MFKKIFKFLKQKDAPKPTATLDNFANALASLIPVSQEDISAIRKAYPYLPEDYFEFLAKYGVGTIDAPEWYVYKPIDAEKIYGSTSALIYNSDAGKSVFPREETNRNELDDAVMIYDTGASWKYGFAKQHGKQLCLFEACGPMIEPLGQSFTEELAEGLESYFSVNT